MCCRFGRAVHVLLTLAAVGCCGWLLWKDQHRPAPAGSLLESGPDRPRLPADDALRSFLNVRSISGDYQLPEGETFGVIVLLWFEDGKFQGRRGTWQITGSPEGTRTVSYQLLWGPGPDGRVQLVGGTRTPNEAGYDGPRRDVEFLAKLNGAILTGSGSTPECRGYRVLAHANSKETRDGQPTSFGPVLWDIEHYKAVGVVGVKTFATREQARACFFAKERLDP